MHILYKCTKTDCDWIMSIAEDEKLNVHLNAYEEFDKHEVACHLKDGAFLGIKYVDY